MERQDRHALELVTGNAEPVDKPYRWRARLRSYSVTAPPEMVNNAPEVKLARPEASMT